MPFLEPPWPTSPSSEDKRTYTSFPARFTVDLEQRIDALDVDLVPTIIPMPTYTNTNTYTNIHPNAHSHR